MKSSLTLQPSAAHLGDSPFGLCVNQDVFQQKMDFILETCPGVTDDIAVHGPTEKEHDEDLHNLMLVARQHGLVFNLDKCHIKETKITFFDMLFDAGVHPDPEEVEMIRAIQDLHDTQELQTFLGRICLLCQSL